MGNLGRMKIITNFSKIMSMGPGQGRVSSKLATTYGRIGTSKKRRKRISNPCSGFKITSWKLYLKEKSKFIYRRKFTVKTLVVDWNLKLLFQKSV